MNPNDLSIKTAELAQLLGVFSELLQKAERFRSTDLTGGSAGFDRLCKRGVKILRTLRTQDPKCYDDLQFIDGGTAYWAFLYAQSGTPIVECARILKIQARKSAGGAPSSKACATWLPFNFDFYPLIAAEEGKKVSCRAGKMISGVR